MSLKYGKSFKEKVVKHTGLIGFYTFILLCGMMSGCGSDHNNTSTTAYVQEEATTAPLPTTKNTTKNTTAELTTAEPNVTIADITQAPKTEAATEPETEPKTEPKTEPETEPETEKTTAEKTTSEKMVWIDDTGKRYHSKSSCSNMDAPYQVPLSEAERRGYTPCGRKGCW